MFEKIDNFDNAVEFLLLKAFFYILYSLGISNWKIISLKIKQLRHFLEIMAIFAWSRYLQKLVSVGAIRSCIPKAIKKRLWNKCLPVNLATFWRKPFLQNTSGRLLLLLAFQKQPPEVFYEKSCSWKFRKIHRQATLICKIFKNTFFTEQPWTTASGNVTKRSLSRNTNLRTTVQVISFISRQHKLSVYVFIGLHCLAPEEATRVEVFSKKGVFKDFVNFIGKHLCGSLLLIKLQAWHLFWRTFANDCFCTALAPIIVTYSFYFIFVLLIAAYLFYFKEFKSGISFSLKSLSSQLFSFSMLFLPFSVLFHFFLSLLIKRILLSWELIKMFLPPLTSLKYVHVSK